MVKTIVKNFIGTLKENNLYYLFYLGMGYKSSVASILNDGKNVKKNESREGNPFIGCKDVNAIERVLNELNHNIRSHMHSKRPEGSKLDVDVELITMTINHLIHFFLEAQGMPMDVMNKIGQEVFDKTITKLYGSEFVEKANTESEEASKIMGGNCSTEEVLSFLKNEYDRVSDKASLPPFNEWMEELLERFAPKTMEDAKKHQHKVSSMSAHNSPNYFYIDKDDLSADHLF